MNSGIVKIRINAVKPPVGATKIISTRLVNAKARCRVKPRNPLIAFALISLKVGSKSFKLFDIGLFSMYGGRN